jgi:DNA-binding PadR family transcriptional regulator
MGRRSLLPTPYSLLPTPYSLLPTPYFLASNLSIYIGVRYNKRRTGPLDAEMPRSTAELPFPLPPAWFHLLLALAGGERHGYALMKDIAEESGGQIRLGPGTLYGALKRLLELKVVVESGRRPDPELDDERRRYYRLTAAGRQLLGAEAARHDRLVNLARSKRVLPRPRPA